MPLFGKKSVQKAVSLDSDEDEVNDVIKSESDKNSEKLKKDAASTLSNVEKPPDLATAISGLANPLINPALDVMEFKLERSILQTDRGEKELEPEPEPEPDPEELEDVDREAEPEEDEEEESRPRDILPIQAIQLPQMTASSSVVAEDDDEDDEDDDEIQLPIPEGSYDAADYDHLEVNAELKELFTYITRYTPQTIELEHRLRPYIPDYIPAVGDIDAFIKIGPPDSKESTLGLTVLDEPSARQSDSTVLDLQLRAVAKHKTERSVIVKTIDNAEKNGKVIDKWIRDISDLHRAKPPPTVHYSKRMPDIDSLMQEWPSDVEEMLKDIRLPSAALEIELSHYVDMICGLLDIPVYKSRIQSLHVLFTLYSVFKNSAHFRHLADEDISLEEESLQADRLVIR